MVLQHCSAPHKPEKLQFPNAELQVSNVELQITNVELQFCNSLGALQLMSSKPFTSPYHQHLEDWALVLEPWAQHTHLEQLVWQPLE